MQTSAIRFSQIKDRIDAEYYKPEYLSNLELFRGCKLPKKSIKEISKSVINFGAYSLCNYIFWVDKGTPFLNVKDIKENDIDWSDVKYISSEVHEILHKAKVKPRQILLTMAGTLGIVAVAPENLGECNSNQAIAKITIRDGLVNPYFLSTFLNSKFGRLQTEREGTGGVQRNINLGQIQTVLVPIPSQSFQQKIEKIVKEAQEKRKLADEKYKKAEEILNKELGLEGLGLFTQKTFEAKFSETVDRFDPEYYQPKYKTIISRLKSQKTKLLGEIVKIRKGIEVGHEAYTSDGKPFIRVQDYNEKEISISESTNFIRSCLYEKLKKKHKPNIGEIIYSKDGTVGRAFVVSKDNHEFIVSGGILILTPRDVDNYYLVLVLNSELVRSQAIRKSMGAIIQHLSIEEVKNLETPILTQFTQQKISSLIQESFQFSKETKELIEKAKREVEKLIEKK